MNLSHEQIQALKAAAEKATALNLDSAQIVRGNDGHFECPVCGGAGEVEEENDFCNIDGVALGVQFYGIGEYHGAAEAYFRAVPPAVILSLLAEREADKALIAKLQNANAAQDDHINQQADRIESLEKTNHGLGKRLCELEARPLTVKLPAPRRVKLVGGDYVHAWTGYDVDVAIRAAGITLVVGWE